MDVVSGLIADRDFRRNAKALSSGWQIGMSKASAPGTHNGERMEDTFGFETKVVGLAASVLPEETHAGKRLDFFSTIFTKGSP